MRSSTASNTPTMAFPFPSAATATKIDQIDVNDHGSAHGI